MFQGILGISSFPLEKQIFNQVEVGVHICEPATSSLFSPSTQTNSKLIRTVDTNLEYRTFFWCRSGTCELNEQDEMTTYYGCSESTLTSESNFGFHICLKSSNAKFYLLEKLQRQVLRNITR